MHYIKPASAWCLMLWTATTFFWNVYTYFENSSTTNKNCIMKKIRIFFQWKLPRIALPKTKKWDIFYDVMSTSWLFWSRYSTESINRFLIQWSNNACTLLLTSSMYSLTWSVTWHQVHPWGREGRVENVSSSGGGAGCKLRFIRFLQV